MLSFFYRAAVAIAYEPMFWLNYLAGSFSSKVNLLGQTAPVTSQSHLSPVESRISWLVEQGAYIEGDVPEHAFNFFDAALRLSRMAMSSDGMDLSSTSDYLEGKLAAVEADCVLRGIEIPDYNLEKYLF